MITVAMGLLATGGCGLLSSDDERAVGDAGQSPTVPAPGSATGTIITGTTMRPPAATWPTTWPTTVGSPGPANTNTTEVVVPSPSPIRPTAPPRATTTSSLSTTTTIVLPRTVVGVVDVIEGNALHPHEYAGDNWPFTRDEGIQRIREAWQVAGVADPVDDLPDAVLRLARGMFARCGDEWWHREHLHAVLREVWIEEYSWGTAPVGISALGERLPEELLSSSTTSPASHHFTLDDYMRILTEVVESIGEEAQIRLVVWWSFLMASDYSGWGCPQMGVGACEAEIEVKLTEGEFSAEEAASAAGQCTIIVDTWEQQALLLRESGADEYCVASALANLRSAPYIAWEYSTEHGYEPFDNC